VYDATYHGDDDVDVDDDGDLDAVLMCTFGRIEAVKGLNKVSR
jgi:hypothetical protein